MHKKITSIVVFIIACFALAASAQPAKDRFSPKEYVKHLESFIVKEACLSPIEAKDFFPLFHEMHNKQRGINWQIMELKKRRLTPNAPDKEYYNIIRDINKLKIESAEIEESYYKKMCKAISAKKVHAAMLAEDKFHRKMLRRFSAPPKKRNH